jgi:hypothetical protein
LANGMENRGHKAAREKICPAPVSVLNILLARRCGLECNFTNRKRAKELQEFRYSLNRFIGFVE